ncbi:hypothetical protein [Oscillatoria salina]|uniref:hypothetical protein n=1 Tax=Oscillatoria salina TaxID=331517 RepID=UPI0013BC4135|nr:hypothetical protein [Oscillatoria salina]MBZ8179580.1 hypothetical protein [Oscillatoria salina IIICB1]NET88985.1 hypothetical protein [Kamptonema sp. SIO1D9]
MSQNAENKAPEKKEPETVKVEELVSTPNKVQNNTPQELADNPAVTPQMINDPKDDRGDLSRD